MSPGQIAFLALVLVGYAVFIAVLGFYWIWSSFGSASVAKPDVDAGRAGSHGPRPA